MIQVRFIYRDNLIGEWADALDGAYLYPNPEFRADVIAVQVRDDGNSPLPRHGAHTRSRAKNKDAAKTRTVVPNGEEQEHT